MKQETPKLKYRVSREGGWMMMAVALFLDLLPFMVLVGVAALVMSTSLNAASALKNEQCRRAEDPSTGAIMTGVYTIACAESNAIGYVFGNSSTATAVATAVGAFFFAGPIMFISSFIFFVSAVVASLIAFILFPLWFWFGKHYNMVSFTHPGKVVTNLSSFMITTIMKWMPIINLFPVPVYTLTVWRHVQLSRHEDREEHREKLKKSMKTLKRELDVAKASGKKASPSTRAEYARQMEQMQYLPNPD